MKITLSLHREAPESPGAALRTLEDREPTLVALVAGEFLTEALERMSVTIKPGEERVVGIGVRIEG